MTSRSEKQNLGQTENLYFLDFHDNYWYLRDHQESSRHDLKSNYQTQLVAMLQESYQILEDSSQEPRYSNIESVFPSPSCSVAFTTIFQKISSL